MYIVYADDDIVLKVNLDTISLSIRILNIKFRR